MTNNSCCKWNKISRYVNDVMAMTCDNRFVTSSNDTSSISSKYHFNERTCCKAGNAFDVNPFRET